MTESGSRTCFEVAPLWKSDDVSVEDAGKPGPLVSAIQDCPNTAPNWGGPGLDEETNVQSFVVKSSQPGLLQASQVLIILASFQHKRPARSLHHGFAESMACLVLEPR